MTDAERKRWLAAWRAVSREVVDPDAAPGGTTRPADDASGLARQAARRLLDADPQLRAALEYLRNGSESGEDSLTASFAGARPARRRIRP